MGTNCGNAQVPEGERGGQPATTAGHTGHQGPAAGLPFRRYLFGLHLAHPFSCDLLVIARELDQAKSSKINYYYYIIIMRINYGLIAL